MIRLIIWVILFFLFYAIIKTIRNAIKSVDKEENKQSHVKMKNSKYQIKEDDIIEAKFEDIIPKDKDNSKK